MEFSGQENAKAQAKAGEKAVHSSRWLNRRSCGMLLTDF